MKGIYEAKPNFPKYRTIWNVGTVFNYYFKQIEHQDQMPVSLLGKKVALLMGLLSGGQRYQTLHSLNIDKHINLSKYKCFFARAKSCVLYQILNLTLIKQNICGITVDCLLAT